MAHIDLRTALTRYNLRKKQTHKNYMSVKRLSELSGISTRALNYWLSKKPNETITGVLKVCDILNTTPTEILKSK